MITRPVLFRVVVVSVLLSAALGITALFVGDLGLLEAKVLLSTCCVALWSVFAGACIAVRDRGGARGLASGGVVLASLAALLALGAVWGEPHNEGYAKTLGTLAFAATFCTHGALMWWRRLAGRYAHLRVVTVAASAALTLLLGACLWRALAFQDVWRLAAALGIVVAAGTLVATAHMRLDRRGPAADGGGGGEQARCPRCGARGPLDGFRIG